MPYKEKEESYLYRMKIAEIISYLESLAPLSSQESYDNSGLIVGDSQNEVKKTLISLDCTEDVIEEAIEIGANLVIAHHPIVFKGLKKINGKSYVERTIIKAIKNDIAIYAIHTNLDNYNYGVNRKIGELLGLNQMSILAPAKNSLHKISVFVPNKNAQEVANAMHNEGAGEIGNYSNCSYQTEGIGTFKPSLKANPYLGEKDKIHSEPEVKLEVIASTHKTNKIINAMLAAHPYEEVAFDIFPLENRNYYEGAGMYGDLNEPIDTIEFLKKIKQIFNSGCIRHTKILKDKIQRIAWCGGSGSFLLGAAKSMKADIYITGDFKYHEFFDAENQILIADIGHFESEQFTVNLINELLAKKFTNFAAYLSKINTNPIKYL